jgi:Tfp pilus assembly protein PilV
MSDAMIWKNQEGMSLIEVIVAILLAAIAIIPLLQFFVTGSAFTATARHEVTALNFAQELIEELKSVNSRQIGVARECTETGNNKIRLANDAGNISINHLITITAGKGEGQVRKITGYKPSNQVATVTPAWDTGKAPDDTSHYLVCGNGSILTGAVQSGTANTVRLAGNENSKNDFFKDYFIMIAGGEGAGQVQKIKAYNGTSKIAAVESNWHIQPDATSFYRLYRYEYKIEVTAAAENLKTIKVTAFYPSGDSLKELSLTTEKHRR